MLRIWIVPIIVCFTLGIFAEKAKSDLIPIKKNIIKRKRTPAFSENCSIRKGNSGSLS